MSDPIFYLPSAMFTKRLGSGRFQARTAKGEILNLRTKGKGVREMCIGCFVKAHTRQHMNLYILEAIRGANILVHFHNESWVVKWNSHNPSCVLLL